MTGRQREVAELVAQGWTNKEIGRELGISHLTVKNHLHCVLTAAGLKRRAAIGLWLANLHGELTCPLGSP